MARSTNDRDITPLLSAVRRWIERCLLEDGSLLDDRSLWTPPLIEELRSAFVDHPDSGDDDFMTKLRGQMKSASPAGRQLMAEMMWALLLFPSNIGAEKKRQHILEIWSWSEETLPPDNPMLQSPILQGVGPAGTAYNNLRWSELAYLIALCQSIKSMSTSDRRMLLEDYDRFMEWIESVPRDGDRQFRHMLRYFAYPDRVERMSSNRDRFSVLEGFRVASRAQLNGWNDRQLDDALLNLRRACEARYPGKVLDFYEPPLEALWRPAKQGESPMPGSAGQAMNESQATQRIYAYLTQELGYPNELIQREYQTSRNARLDLVVMLNGRIRIVCEAKRLDKLPQDAKLLPFDALVRQIQFAALEVGARFFLVSDGRQMLWFETDETGRPLPLVAPKTYRELLNEGSNIESRASRMQGVRRTFRNLLERSRQQRWSPEALALILYAYLQRLRGREFFCELLVGGSDHQAALAAARSETLDASNAGFTETLAFVARQDLTSPRAYAEALDLLDASALDELAPTDALTLLDDVLGRYPTSSGATRLPRWISDLLVHLADIKRGDRVLDLHCGLGNLSAAVRLTGVTQPSHMALFARHATDAMWACVQQLVFGAELPSILIGDPIESTRLENLHEGLVDRILIAPPFGLTVRHERFGDQRGSTLSSEEAYLHLALEHLSPRGRIVALVPNGALGSPDRSPLRELLLRNGLKAVLDVGTFQPDSGAAASIVVLDKSTPARDVLFFAKAQNRQQQDSFNCTSLPGLAHVLHRFGLWMQGLDIGNDTDLGLTAMAAPEQGVLSVGPYLARQAQRQLPLASFEHHPLASLALVTKGGAIRRSKDAGDVVFIGPGSIRPLEIQLDPLDRADDTEVQRHPKAVASEGDIVVNGLSTYLGAAALVQSGRFPINRHIFRIRIEHGLVLPEYLVIAINSRHVHEALLAAAGGSVMTMLRLEILKQVLIPVPPLDIQSEIVRRVTVAKKERDAVEELLQQKELALTDLVRNLELGESA